MYFFLFQQKQVIKLDAQTKIQKDPLAYQFDKNIDEKLIFGMMLVSLYFLIIPFFYFSIGFFFDLSMGWS